MNKVEEKIYKEIYLLPYQTTSETKLISFEYKVLNIIYLQEINCTKPKVEKLTREPLGKGDSCPGQFRRIASK